MLGVVWGEKVVEPSRASLFPGEEVGKRKARQCVMVGNRSTACHLLISHPVASRVGAGYWGYPCICPSLPVLNLIAFGSGGVPPGGAGGWVGGAPVGEAAGLKFFPNKAVGQCSWLSDSIFLSPGAGALCLWLPWRRRRGALPLSPAHTW